MNVKITHSWLLDYLDTDATPVQIQKYLSLCGPSIEQIEEVDGEVIYDIEITSNRIDTASVLGIAREAAAILPQFGKKAILKKRTSFELKSESEKLKAPISITDPHAVCRRVLGIVMEVNGANPSPEFMSKRVVATGTRSINNLVDVTNYVMTEIGHPCHVFDYDRITTHKLILRHAKKGEEIITLDEKTYQLDEKDIVIDDGTGKVIDLPGIMGTANSVVTNDTKRILFFIESNDPISIRRTSMKYGIRTMASTINEKNPDPELAYTAFLRGIELYKEVAHAKPLSPVIDIYPEKQKPGLVTTSKTFIDSKVGVAIPLKTIVSILTNLEFVVTVKNNNELTITVPTHRVADVAIPEDIVEEVARVYGYHSIPSILQSPVYVAQPKDSELLFHYQYAVKSYLKHRGYTEVMNYSAVSNELLKQFELDQKDYLYITNSISEEIKYLRQSLIPSLIKNVKQNEGFLTKFCLFEVAKTYVPKPNKLPNEEFTLSIVVNTSLDDLKKIIWGLFDELNIKITIANSREIRDFFLNNVQGHVSDAKVLFGSFGQIKSKYCMNLNIDQPIYAAEFSFEKMMHVAHAMPFYRAFSTYAHIIQDITVKKSKSFSDMEKAAFNASPLLESVSVKDQYQDNITLHLTFTDHTRNIKESEVKGEVERIQSALTTK